MANTLTGLIPDFYRAMDVVLRELTGLIPSVTLDADASRAAVGQNITLFRAPAGTAEDVTPGTNPPDTGDQAFENYQLSITKARAVPFRWTGEEQRSVRIGHGYLTMRQDQIAQALRTLVNEVEGDLAGLYHRTSRAYGTAGTTPFASGVGDTAQLLKILQDNGAPLSELQLVIDTAAGVNIRSHTQLTKANESNDDSILRQGILGNLHGFNIRESAQVKLHTSGAGASFLVNDASGIQVGDVAVAYDGAGSGSFLKGDVVSFGGSDKYVIAANAAGGAFNVNKPGARSVIADNTAITTAASYRANMAFHRSAMILLARPPAIPEEGDMATDATLITDPRTGLTFEIRMYAQYRRIRYEVALAWGVANIKPEMSALLLG